ncbi:conjugative transposon protein TraM [Emticicia sp. W12TSBA100-4]|uniref:conjugative transposon protein TraM n=1 Tax=Emticicia sp. W12TSBA100-4 TaxID=3160965 RepID=UPI003305C6B6
MSSANRLEENQEAQKEVEIPNKPILSRFAKIKVFLKKNWAVLLILLLTISSYIVLQSVKNDLQSKTGEQAGFKSGETPDLAKENKAKEEAQTQIDRVGAAGQANNQINETKTMEADSNELVQFSMVNAYKKTQSNEVQKVAVTKQDTIKIVEKNDMRVVRPKNNTQIFAAKSKREKIKVSKNEIIPDTEGFNTVVVSSKKSVENTTNKEFTSPKRYYKAVVYGNQTVRSGSQVRIRLLESLTVDGQTIPPNSLCTGIALLGSNRVTIALTSVQVHGQQMSIKSIVFDKDLLPGIAFSNETEVQQSIRQQRNSGIDQASNDVINNIPQIGGTAGAALSTGVGVINGISKSIRYGGVQKNIGEITLEEGYRVFIQQ